MYVLGMEQVCGVGWALKAYHKCCEGLLGWTFLGILQLGALLGDFNYRSGSLLQNGVVPVLLHCIMICLDVASNGM